jgi:hypothetical protein
MLRRVALRIYKSGTGNVVLFLTLIATCGWLAAGVAFPTWSHPGQHTVALIIILISCAKILYLALERRGHGAAGLSEVGIQNILNGMDSVTVGSLLATPGRKELVNIWLRNRCDLMERILEAVRDDNDFVDIYLLWPCSDFAQARGGELGASDVPSRIETDLNDLITVFRKLGRDSQKRLKVHLYESYPKFLYYSSGERALVGLFWIGTHAINGPVLEICVGRGRLWTLIADYMSRLKLTSTDVSAALIEGRIPKREEYASVAGAVNRAGQTEGRLANGHGVMPASASATVGSIQQGRPGFSIGVAVQPGVSLSRLLASAFTIDEMRRLLVESVGGGRELVADLPTEHCSKAKFFHEVVELAHRRRMVDVLLVEVVQDRPELRPELNKLGL